jgi:hypothetical protein
MPQRSRGLFFFVLALAVSASFAGEPGEDHRAWQHGIDLIRVGNKLLVVWGSPGNPPQPNLGGDWQHDVYYAWLNNSVTQDDTTIDPRILVSLPEAQEPPSVAINNRGTILMTSEDGDGGINQHAGLWNSSLSVLRKYPFTIKRGGHSGHVAAMGDRFLVAYDEGWVDGGGWHGLGTGENVFGRIVEDNGIVGREVKLTPDRNSVSRDDWPLVAGSDRNWLVVWQRYPQLTLQSALVDTLGNVVKRRQIIDGMSLGYAYDVEFSQRLAAYVVAGETTHGGFVALINLNGDIVKTQGGLPPMVSESRIILGLDGSQLIGIYPVRPRGSALIHLSGDAIELVKVIDNPYVWDYSGTTGTFVAPDQVLFATLSTTGLHLIKINTGTWGNRGDSTSVGDY